MNTKSLLGNTVKIACVTCITLGVAAAVTGGAALKAARKGGAYLVKTVEKLLGEEPEALTEEVTEEDFAGETE